MEWDAEPVAFECRLWVGDQRSSEDAKQLHAHGITHIISIREPGLQSATVGFFRAVTGLPRSFCRSIHQYARPFDRHLVTIPGIRYLRFWCEDEPESDIYHAFGRAARFVQRAFDSGPLNRVLVHCASGVSRSITLSIAIELWFQYTKSVEQLIHLRRAARDVANPNPGFVRQLERWRSQRSANDRRTSEPGKEISRATRTIECLLEHNFPPGVGAIVVAYDPARLLCFGAFCAGQLEPVTEPIHVHVAEPITRESLRNAVYQLDVRSGGELIDEVKTMTAIQTAGYAWVKRPACYYTIVAMDHDCRLKPCWTVRREATLRVTPDLLECILSFARKCKIRDHICIFQRYPGFYDMLIELQPRTSAIEQLRFEDEISAILQSRTRSVTRAGLEKSVKNYKLTEVERAKILRTAVPIQQLAKEQHEIDVKDAQGTGGSAYFQSKRKWLQERWDKQVDSEASRLIHPVLVNEPTPLKMSILVDNVDFFRLHYQPHLDRIRDLLDFACLCGARKITEFILETFGWTYLSKSQDHLLGYVLASSNLGWAYDIASIMAKANHPIPSNVYGLATSDRILDDICRCFSMVEPNHTVSNRCLKY